MQHRTLLTQDAFDRDRRLTDGVAERKFGGASMAVECAEVLVSERVLEVDACVLQSLLLHRSGGICKSISSTLQQ